MQKEGIGMIQAINGLQTSTGRWVTLTEFDTDEVGYDAQGWIDKVARVGMNGGSVELPCGGFALIGRFDAFRSVVDL